MDDTLDLGILCDAFEALPEAVVVCDAADRIVFANRRFRALNGAAGHAVDAGTSYADFLEAALAAGEFPDAAGREAQWLEEVLARRRAGAPWEAEVRRGGGVWTRLRFTRLPDGGSMVCEADITARRQAEHALSESEERVRDVAQASGDWFWDTDTRHCYTWISESIERHVGHPASHYVGRNRMEVAAAAGEDVGAEPWTSHLAALARREPFRDFRTLRHTPKGEVWLAVSGVPRFDAAGEFLGYRSVVRNVTAEVATERRARAADERLRAAIENLNDSIAVTDADDRIVLTNRKFRELNGGTGLIDVGRKYEDHLRAGIPLGNYPDARARGEAWLAQRMAHRRAGGTIEVKRQDGIWLMVTDHPLPDGGLISFALDVTRRKEAEELLKRVNAELELRVAERTAQLETANRELEAFSYSVSHDLRAPLRAIAGFVNVLLEEEGERLSDQGRRHLGIVDASARRMGRLIDSLLALGRMSRTALTPAPVDLTALAEEVCREFAPAYPGSAIEIRALPQVMGDATLLRQVLVNLIGNALKYSRKAAAPRVEIAAEDGACVVRDNGVGFDPAYRQKLFQPFQRLHADRDFEGAGVGLAIVKLIVERHGGNIAAEGAPGAGATFRLALPAAR